MDIEPLAIAPNHPVPGGSAAKRPQQAVIASMGNRLAEKRIDLGFASLAAGQHGSYAI